MYLSVKITEIPTTLQIYAFSPVGRALSSLAHRFRVAGGADDAGVRSLEHTGRRGRHRQLHHAIFT